MKLAAQSAARFLAKPAQDVRAALLYGPNRALVAESAEAVIKALLGPAPDAMAVTRLGDDELRRDFALLSDQLAAQSLLGGPRVLRVRADGDAAAEPIAATLAALDAGAPAAAYLLVEGGDLAARSKVRAAFEAAKSAVAIPFYEEDEAAIAQFAAAALKAAGVTLDDGARAVLEASLPPDRGVIRGEIEKLALYAHGRSGPIAAAEIAALLAVEGEAALDDAGLAAAGGRASDAVEALHRAGVGAITALKALERRLLRLQEARAAVDRGASPSDAAGGLRPPVFWKERDAFAAQLRGWTAQRLAAALDALWRAQVRAMTAGAPQELIAAEAYRAVANLANRR